MDVLVLGAGLAGLRAALSALEARPGARVLVASATGKPSGSSFANQNDALGMHACLTDAEREAYLAEVAALNGRASLFDGQAPGPGGSDAPARAARKGQAGSAGLAAMRPLSVFIDPALLAIQVLEGADRLRDLEALGLDFTRGAGGALLPHSSCFSPHSRRAYIFTGLARAHERFMERLGALGCLFAHGYLAASILKHEDAAAGAVLVPSRGGEPAAVAARAVVVALGGPARLFAHSMAGLNPGFGHGLLTRAGARMANLGYLQYMWGTLPGRRFWQPAELGQGRWRIVSADGAAELCGAIGSSGADRYAGPAGPGIPAAPPPDARGEGPGALVKIAAEDAIPDLAALCVARAGHCPYGYGLPDSAIDLALARAMDADGVVTLIRPDGQPLRVAPMAHASNGGAVIDEWGQTSVPGLFAVGECATGMHGANRIGGGMVLATQVFGCRAGMRAAGLARGGAADSPPAAKGLRPLESASIRGGDAMDPREFRRRPLTRTSDSFMPDIDERREGLAWLARGLSRYAALGGRPGREAFTAEVHARLQAARDWRLRLSLATAAGIMDGLPETD